MEIFNPQKGSHRVKRDLWPGPPVSFGTFGFPRFPKNLPAWKEVGLDLPKARAGLRRRNLLGSPAGVSTHLGGMNTPGRFWRGPLLLWAPGLLTRDRRESFGGPFSLPQVLSSKETNFQPTKLGISWFKKVWAVVYRVFKARFNKRLDFFTQVPLGTGVGKKSAPIWKTNRGGKKPRRWGRLKQHEGGKPHLEVGLYPKGAHPILHKGPHTHKLPDVPPQVETNPRGIMSIPAAWVPHLGRPQHQRDAALSLQAPDM